jgi:hypothetical protein
MLLAAILGGLAGAAASEAWRRWSTRSYRLSKPEVARLGDALLAGQPGAGRRLLQHGIQSFLEEQHRISPARARAVAAALPEFDVEIKFCKPAPEAPGA